MHPSSTYERILEEGRREGGEEGLRERIENGRRIEARRFVLLIGNCQYGKPNESTKAIVEAIQDIDLLERLVFRLYDRVDETWDEFVRAIPAVSQVVQDEKTQ